MLTPAQESIITSINGSAVDVRNEIEGQNAQLGAKDFQIAQLEAGVNPAMQTTIDGLTLDKSNLLAALLTRTSERDAALATIDSLNADLAASNAARDDALARLAALNNGIDELQGQTPPSA